MPVAFVAGATGYTGREVVRRLRARKIDTIAHVRPDSGSLESWRTKFERLGARVDTTPWEPEAMAATLAAESPDLVFGLLGTTRARAAREARAGVSKEENSYERVDFGMTKMLLDATAALAPPRRFIYLSAIGADAGANPYMAVRKRIEAALREADVEWVSARPSWITGSDREESRPGERLAATASDAAMGFFRLFGAKKLDARYRSITATELANGLVHHALEPSSANRVIETDQLRGY